MGSPTLRQRKKDDTRQTISVAASKLIAARGFDAVTVSEIATAAGVSKMTVFNYFSRKEELFFDRNEEARGVLARILDDRRDGEATLDLLQRSVHQLADEAHVFVRFTRSVSSFWRTVDASDALKAYVREVRSEADGALAEVIARDLGGERERERDIDANARLIAGILVTGWATAYAEALRRLRAGDSKGKASRAFLSLIDHAFDAARAAAVGTPYAAISVSRRARKK